MPRFWLSARLSYRALFTWLNPVGYVASRFLAPILTVLIFATAAQHTGNNTARPVIGGAMMAVTAAAMFGVTLSVANERFYGTLGAWLSAPQGLVPSILGKSVSHAVDGLLSAAVTFVVTTTVFGIGVTPSDLLALLLSAVAAATGGTGLGVLVAGLAVAFRDTFTAANIASAVLTVISGAFLPVTALPSAAQALSPLLPLRHATDAAIAHLNYNRLDWPSLGLECATGFAWATAGFVLLTRMISHARRRATWDLR